MNNRKYQKQTPLLQEKPKKIDDEELWKSFQIDFLPEAREFPDNKIYGIIRIIPDSARKLIAKFLLIVNGHNRGDINFNYDNISISGFAIENDKKLTVEIQAIPIDNDWKTPKKSKSRDFTLTGQILSLSPIISFEWPDGSPNAIIVVKWNHINDQLAQKYVLCLDKKEVYYVNQRSLSDILETCIYYLEPGKEYTIQIISKLNNGKVTYKSDPITFTVPKEKNEYHSEVLSVLNERVPYKLKDFAEIEEEKKVPLPESESEPKLDSLKDRALELLQKLRNQIEKRNRR